MRGYDMTSKDTSVRIFNTHRSVERVCTATLPYQNPQHASRLQQVVHVGDCGNSKGSPVHAVGRE